MAKNKKGVDGRGERERDSEEKYRLDQLFDEQNQPTFFSSWLVLLTEFQRTRYYSAISPKKKKKKTIWRLFFIYCSLRRTIVSRFFLCLSLVFFSLFPSSFSRLRCIWSWKALNEMWEDKDCSNEDFLFFRLVEQCFRSWRKSKFCSSVMHFVDWRKSLQKSEKNRRDSSGRMSKQRK